MLLWLSSELRRLLGVAGALLVDKKKRIHPLYVLQFGKYDSIRLLSWLYKHSEGRRLERKFAKWQRYLVIEGTQAFTYRRASTHRRVRGSLDRSLIHA